MDAHRLSLLLVGSLSIACSASDPLMSGAGGSGSEAASSTSAATSGTGGLNLGSGGNSNGSGGGTSTNGCSADLQKVIDENGNAVPCPPDQGCFNAQCVPACNAAAQSKG